MELNDSTPMGLATLYPLYLRGEAYLLRQDGLAAAREFQIILDHPTLVLNFPLHPLSLLKRGRAQRLSGDAAAAQRSYRDFLGLWKTADPGVPILKEAKVGYAGY